MSLIFVGKFFSFDYPTFVVLLSFQFTRTDYLFTLGPPVCPSFSLSYTIHIITQGPLVIP